MASMSTPTTIKEPRFFEYVFKNKQHQKMLLIAFAANILLFFVFKIFCPNAFFISDSNAYILAATNSAEIMYRPYGYPQFLQLIHSFSNNLDFLLWIQFLLLFIAGQFTFFSIDFLYRFNNATLKKLSWFLITFNPCLILLANFVLTDAIFTSLSAIYITSLLWIVRRPNWWVIALQVFILYWTFQIRYTALYYPILTLIAFLLSKKSTFITKAIGIAASFLLIFASYKHIKSKVYEATDVDIFSGFSGWQMANNVLGIYPHINTSQDEFPDADIKLLDTISRIYIDSLPANSLKKLHDGKLIPDFLWNPKSPLKVYTFVYMNKYRVPYFVAWYQVSQVFDDFSKTIIKNHPSAFLKYYIVPNTKLYFWPEPEDMEGYSLSWGEVPQSTVDWFDLKSKQSLSPVPNFQKASSLYSQILILVISLLNIILPIVYYIKRKRINQNLTEDDTKSVIFWWLVVGCNMAFSIFAALIVLRYECLWLIIGFGFPMIMLDRLLTMRKTTQS